MTDAPAQIDPEPVLDAQGLGPTGRPHPDLPEVTYVVGATEPVVIQNMDAGGIDLAILDGEAERGKQCLPRDRNRGARHAPISGLPSKTGSSVRSRVMNIVSRTCSVMNWSGL